MPTQSIVQSVTLAERSPAQIGREFRTRVAEGLRIRPAGSARSDPEGLLARGYTPKHRTELFGTTFYLTHNRIDENFRFFVAYVILPGSRDAWPRIFYKDSSLIWRSATHYIRSDEENWIGKGDTKWVRVGDEELLCSAEETTNLPYELQGALDTASRAGGKARTDARATDLILRRAPDHRLEPYEDFSGPRRRAHRNPRHRINGGRSVAVFVKPGDPSSLRFVRGFAPDFDRGVVDETRSRSNLYGGEIRKFRILSANRQIQYQFITGPELAWIIPPQTVTSELSSYGVRTLDVEADEDLCVPGYEYHFIDPNQDPPALFSQIPVGFAGKASEIDPDRADAAKWIDAMPVIGEFRRKVLGRR